MIEFETLGNIRAGLFPGGFPFIQLVIHPHHMARLFCWRANQFQLELLLLVREHLPNRAATVAGDPINSPAPAPPPVQVPVGPQPMGNVYSSLSDFTFTFPSFARTQAVKQSQARITLLTPTNEDPSKKKLCYWVS